jgi:hypothetical protein
VTDSTALDNNPDARSKQPGSADAATTPAADTSKNNGKRQKKSK